MSEARQEAIASTGQLHHHHHHHHQHHHHHHGIGVTSGGRDCGVGRTPWTRAACPWRWVLVWMLLLWPWWARAITLPVAMPPSHPKHFLTVAGQGAEGRTSATHPASSLVSNQVPTPGIEGRAVREDEVMYHLYKNGRVGTRYYRKASTVFMVRLFNDLLRGLAHVPGARGRKGRAGPDPRARDREEEEEALTDTIRSFSATEVTFSKKKKATVHFSLPFLPPNERLRSAELRFLRRPAARKRRKKRYKLRVQVLRGGRVTERVTLRERAVVQRDYEVFDLSRVLDSWINAHHGNVSLRVRIPRKLERGVVLSDSALKSTSLVTLYLEDREFLRNMYESYTTDDSGNARNASKLPKEGRADPTDPQRHRTRRQAGDVTALRHGGGRFRREASGRGSREPKRKRHRQRKNKRWYRAPKHEQCQMYDFDVDFDFIGWGQWIIHPKHFNARFCYGVCPSPVETRFKPTNHAMLQTLMRQKKPRLAPPTCCVPTRLKPLSMLYFEYDEIVVRHHENMIADECGCR